MRSMWSGTISFGLVTVPVKMYKATRDNGVKLCRVSPAGNAVGQSMYDKVTSAVVAYGDLRSGVKVPDGKTERIVEIADDELDALRPAKSKAIAIESFVPADAVPALALDSSYWLGPDAGGQTAYALLAVAMAGAGRVAIARVMIRSRERFCAVQVVGGALLLTTLHYADEIESPDEIADAVPLADVDQAQLTAAGQLIAAFSSDEMPVLEDEFRASVEELIASKVAGTFKPVDEAETPELVTTDNLMEALESSLAEVTRDVRAPVHAEPQAD